MNAKSNVNVHFHLKLKGVSLWRSVGISNKWITQQGSFWVWAQQRRGGITVQHPLPLTEPITGMIPAQHDDAIKWKHFRVTGPLCCEFLGHRWIRSFDIFFHLWLNIRLSKQWWGWWFETPSRSLRRHRNVRGLYCVGTENITHTFLKCWVTVKKSCIIENLPFVLDMCFTFSPGAMGLISHTVHGLTIDTCILL